MGIIASRSSRVTDEMFILAAKTLSGVVTDDLLSQGTIYPPLGKIREVSFEIAVAIASYCFKLGLANVVEPNDVRALIKKNQYDESLYCHYWDNVFGTLEQEFNH